ncbi:unnamed protein product [Closterium sp. NIES-64]|nr:unnamed protein product [Closterium sp. NIES-64]
MQPHRRLRESLTPQQLREWYAGWGCRGGGASTATTPAASTTGGGQMQLPRPPRASLTPQQLREWYAQSRGSLSFVRCSYVILTGARTGQPCGTPGHTQSRCFARLIDAWRTVFVDEAELPDWVELLRQRVEIFALDYDAILTAMYALPTSANRADHLCVPPDPSIGPAALATGKAAAALGASDSPAPGTGAGAALGASESASSGVGEAALSGATLASASLTFTLDSGASRSFFRDRTTLTPLGRPVAVSLADPSGGLVLSHFSTVLPCPAAPSGTQSGLYHPLVLDELGRHLATFSRRPGSSLYTLTTESPPVPASGQVAASGQVFAAASRTFLCPLCRGAPHGCSSLLPVSPDRGSSADTSHGRVGPGPRPWAGHERYFLLVVDDYSRYTTVFPLRSKGAVTEVLIDWIREARLQLRRSFGSDFPVLRLHSDRGGEFSSRLLRDYCRAQGIRQTFTLPDSPQQNGIAERRIGMSWMSLVGDASAFRVWGSRAFVRDLSADKLSPRAASLCLPWLPP